jgi:membrane protease YdiL (CAAX protease family)
MLAAARQAEKVRRRPSPGAEPADQRTPPKAFLCFAVVQILGLAATNHLLTRLVPALLPGAAQSRIHADLRQIGEAAAYDLPSAIVMFAILTGLFEEILFRGLLFAWLERRLGVGGAVLGAAFAFGAAHLDPHLSAIAALLGLQLGLLRSVSGLGLPIAAHIANNLLVLMFSEGAQIGGPDPGAIPANAALLSAGVVSLAAWAGLAQAWRRTRRAVDSPFSQPR